jgi:pullulanase/glycogen debranching enzyme
MGPTLSFRGIDNASYYWLKPDNPRFYDDFTGCGSSVNLKHPRVLQMVMDSLRYWVEVYHVDGFRFDLATTLQQRLPRRDPARPGAVIGEAGRRAVGPWDGRLSGRRVSVAVVGME